jgi:hypothetical protein
MADRKRRSCKDNEGNEENEDPTRIGGTRGKNSSRNEEIKWAQRKK